MKKAAGLISAATIGASLMYLFDPDRGRRRRGEIRNKVRHINHIATDAAGKTRRDLQNHIIGAVSEMQSLLRREKVSDDVLEARVRSKLGRVVSHPHAIEVKAIEGLVILRGPILTAEVHPLLNAVAVIRGVRNIENHLELHETTEDVPALQGGKRRMGERFGPFKSTWSPTTRLIAGIAGGALTVYGGKRRDVVGSFMGSVGLGVLARAFTNLEARQLVGMNGGVKEIEIPKTI
jgi:hypothetical protein